MTTRTIKRRSLALAAGGLVQGILLAHTAIAFNPQPDPPGFGLIGINVDQTIRLNVVCYEHTVGKLPPGPCRGSMMFHDASGTVLSTTAYDLTPGQSATLDYVGRPADVAPGGREGITPCVVPAPASNRAIPSVEVFDSATGRTMLFVNPAVARLSNLQGVGR